MEENPPYVPPFRNTEMGGDYLGRRDVPKGDDVLCQGGIVPEEQERNEPLWMSLIYKYQAGDLVPRNKSKMDQVFSEGSY